MYMHFIGLLFWVHGGKEKGACKCVSVEVGMHAPTHPFPCTFSMHLGTFFHTLEITTLLAHNDLNMKFH
jgi:hypothetical protein